MNFQKLYRKLFVAAILLAIFSYGASLAAWRISGEQGRFPLGVLRAMSHKVTPKIDIKEERELELAGISNLVIETENADVKVVPISQADLHEAVSKESAAVLKLAGQTPEPEEKPETPKEQILAVEREGSTYKIRVNETKPSRKLKLSLNFDGKSDGLSLKLYLPPGFNGRVVTHTINGDVKITGVNLDQVEVSSTAGDLKVNDVEAKSLTAKSISGDMKVISQADALALESTSGDLKVKWHPLTLGNPGHLDLRSVSGDVKVSVPIESNLAVALKSVSGEMKVKFPGFETQNLPGAKLSKGKIGAGLGQLEVSTVSGDMRLEAAKTSDPVPDHDSSAADHEGAQDEE